MSIAELRLSPRRAWRMRWTMACPWRGRLQTEARLARFAALYPRLFGAQPALQGAAAGRPGRRAVAASLAPVTVDLRLQRRVCVRMPDGASPFKSSKT